MSSSEIFAEGVHGLQRSRLAVVFNVSRESRRLSGP